MVSPSSVCAVFASEDLFDFSVVMTPGKVVKVKAEAHDFFHDAAHVSVTDCKICYE
jgi:hypothetical protein